jgi:xylose isomerase
MKEHLRFSIAYWHAFRGTGGDPFGPGTIHSPLGKGQGRRSAIAKVRMEAGFEFFQKIRAPFWCFHDRDIAPEGKHARRVEQASSTRSSPTRSSSRRATGVKLLWGTANLFSNPRFMCGARPPTPTPTSSPTPPRR